MYPSAAVSTDSSADRPKTGVATPAPIFTWTTSSRPVADARSLESLARVSGVGKMKLGPFILFTTLGSIPWNLFLILAGYVLG